MVIFTITHDKGVEYVGRLDCLVGYWRSACLVLQASVDTCGDHIWHWPCMWLVDLIPGITQVVPRSFNREGVQ